MCRIIFMQKMISRGEILLQNIKEKKFVVGTKQTVKAIENDRALTVFLAEDAGEYMRNLILKACESKDIIIENVPTMQELGNSCGISRGAVTAAIIKP